jgi:hypothetical protein
VFMDLWLKVHKHGVQTVRKLFLPKSANNVCGCVLALTYQVVLVGSYRMDVEEMVFNSHS